MEKTVEMVFIFLSSLFSQLRCKALPLWLDHGDTLSKNNKGVESYEEKNVSYQKKYALRLAW